MTQRTQLAESFSLTRLRWKQFYEIYKCELSGFRSNRTLLETRLTLQPILFSKLGFLPRKGNKQLIAGRDGLWLAKIDFIFH